MPLITTPEHQQLIRRFRQLNATYAQNRDLITIGAYAKGSDPRVDEAIQYWPGDPAIPAAGRQRVDLVRAELRRTESAVPTERRVRSSNEQSSTTRDRWPTTPASRDGSRAPPRGERAGAHGQGEGGRAAARLSRRVPAARELAERPTDPLRWQNARAFLAKLSDAVARTRRSSKAVERHRLEADAGAIRTGARSRSTRSSPMRRAKRRATAPNASNASSTSTRCGGCWSGGNEREDGRALAARLSHDARSRQTVVPTRRLAPEERERLERDGTRHRAAEELGERRRSADSFTTHVRVTSLPSERPNSPSSTA